jgi:hypothetical protein
MVLESANDFSRHDISSLGNDVKNSY